MILMTYLASSAVNETSSVDENGVRNWAVRHVLDCGGSYPHRMRQQTERGQDLSRRLAPAGQQEDIAQPLPPPAPRR